MTGENGRIDYERKREIIAITVALTLMVIYIHVTSEAVMKYDKESALYAIAFSTNKLCGFVVQGFIFISALKHFAHSPRDFLYVRFLRRKFTKIITPYIIWVIIYYLYFISIHYFEFNALQLIKHIFLGDLSAPFYFVVIITQFYVLTPLWRLIAKAGVVSVAIIVAASGAITLLSRSYLTEFPYNDRIFVSYVFYWVAGVFCGVHYDGFLRFVRKYAGVCFLTYAVVACAHVWLCYAQSKGLYAYKSAETGQAVFASVSIAALYAAAVLTRVGKKSGLLTRLADASYYIYLTHVLAILITERYVRLSVSGALVAKALVAFTAPAALGILYRRAKEIFHTRLRPRT
ncbi:MAG: acyltransferase [Clostridiales bacterium]|nr:acyltransferase [Clostridiales bacterium]